jgi:signal transduction histidine kinase
MNAAFTSETPPTGVPDHTAASSGRGGRLLRRTFVIALILVSGGLITSGAIELFLRYREGVQNIEVLQREFAHGAAFKIHHFVKEIEKTMRALAQTKDIMAPALSEAYRYQLLKVLNAVPSVTRVAALDGNGREQIELLRLGIVQSEELKDRPSDQGFEQARRGESFYGPVYFVGQSEPYMRIAVPIEQFAGDIIGVLTAEVNLKYIWEVISGIKIGRTGYAYVVSREGDLLAHTDISLVLQRRNLKELSQVQAALAGAPVAFMPQLNLVGEKVFPTFALIPELGWVVLVEQPTGEVYALLYPSIFRTAALLLLGLGMAFVASLLIGRRVVRPVEVLREGAAQIGAGALDHRIDVRTGDELEGLAEEFNRMAAHLQESYTNLEQKVAQRTQQLGNLNARLEEASRLKSQFLANVNHELRTPLSGVLGYGRLLLRKTEGQIDEAQTENIHKLLNTTEHLLDSINSLLDLAKIEAGGMEFRAEPVKMDELINGATATIEPMLEDGDVQLIRDIAPGIPTLNTDQEKLRQIVLNLLSNAAKFTERGEIKISTSQENGSLKLVVSDTGIGIEKGELEDIFEEFHRCDVPGTRKYGGSGLGLAIVKKFVNFLGGDVGVESEVGKGSVFTVTLPLRPRIPTSS